MSHFEYEFNDDDTIRQITKDGVPLAGGAVLEMPQGIVQTYYKAAYRHLQAMTLDAEDHELNRHHGLQGFIMSLVGVEAFLNVFFHLVGRERGLPNVIAMANRTNMTIESKLSSLPRQAYGAPLPAQKRLTKKMRELYKLRSQMVHPKWQPSSISIPGVTIRDMVENEQKLFEDRSLCHDALRWCLLVVARVGNHAASGEVYSQFVWQWTGIHATNTELSDKLGIPRDGA